MNNGHNYVVSFFTNNYPAHACAKGLSNWFCPLSVCLSVCPMKKVFNLNIDRIKQLLKLTVALTL